MKLKRIDIIFIIIFLVLTLISIDLLLVEEHRGAITNIWGTESFDTDELFMRYSIVFLVCVVGNLLPVPTPYSWAVCLGYAYYVINPFIPLLFGIVAASGCLVGEVVGYFVGRGAAEVISDERSEILSKYHEYLVEHPKIAPFLIFLGGLTPINDDMITVPLGLIKYPFKKTIIWLWLGKLGLMLLFAYNAFGLFNICGLIGGENWIFSIISIYIVVLMIYLMIKIDFTKKIREKVKEDSTLS